MTFVFIIKLDTPISPRFILKIHFEALFDKSLDKFKSSNCLMNELFIFPFIIYVNEVFLKKMWF